MEQADIRALQTLVAIVEQGSLRAAARHLGVNPPAVSHQLKTFEERLGSPLFLRSTRSVTLTDAGRALYDGSRHLLHGLDLALDEAREGGGARSGRLRIALSFRAWQIILAPRLAEFRMACPDVELDLAFEEGLTDIVGRGFHAGIRLGDHLQDGMIAVRLSPAEETAYVAAPDYLERRGIPQAPEDLLTHDCIRHRQVSSGRISDWRFLTPHGEVTVDAGGPLVLDDLRAVVDAARRGHGIGWTLKRGVEDDLKEGRLVEVLSDMAPARPGFFLYYPAALKTWSLLRAFIETFRG